MTVSVAAAEALRRLFGSELADQVAQRVAAGTPVPLIVPASDDANTATFLILVNAEEVSGPGKIAYNLAEVAEMTGIPQRSLADGCCAGRIPHRKVGRSRAMTRDDIDRFLGLIQVAITDPEWIQIEQSRRRVMARLAKDNYPR